MIEIARARAPESWARTLPHALIVEATTIGPEPPPTLATPELHPAAAAITAAASNALAMVTRLGTP